MIRVAKVVPSQIIQKTLLARDEWKKANTICLYISLPEEVDTRSLLSEKKSFVVPRVWGSELRLHKIRSLKDVEPGSFGILEPKKSSLSVDKSDVDLFVVPGIAFDRKGYRLGWGKGYYDRLLAGVKATKIGLAYNFQIIPRLPHKKYDIPMDIVITENETITP